MDKLLIQGGILEGKGKSFFVRSLPCMSISLSAEQLAIPAKDVFAVNDAKVPTSQLPELLMSKPALFNEIGWLLANER